VIEILGWVATVIAVYGVVLNNRRIRSCFWLWLLSNAMSCGIHAYLGVWSLAVRDAVFFALAIHGLVLWRKTPDVSNRKGEI
jgi:nicotinamide riboside transporter PnuC